MLHISQPDRRHPYTRNTKSENWVNCIEAFDEDQPEKKKKRSSEENSAVTRLFGH